MNYSAEVLAHYHHPSNVGSLDAQALDVGTGQVGTQAEGAVLRLQVQVDPDGIIRAARFKAYGCGATIAAGSLATQRLQGGTLDDALALDAGAFAQALSLPPVKMYCAMLAEDAIKAAVQDYRNKHESQV